MLDQLMAATARPRHWDDVSRTTLLGAAEPAMRAFGLMLTLAFLAAPAHAQRAEPTLQPQMRSTSFLAGVGNAMGWLGVQGEKYLGSGRVSLFGGLGYTPSVLEGDATGVTVAGGVRGYTAGVRHRGFLELSVAQIEVEQSCFAHCRRPYGPGLQAGYQYVANGGFTASLSGGVGYAPNGSGNAAGLMGLGFGYTWRR